MLTESTVFYKVNFKQNNLSDKRIIYLDVEALALSFYKLVNTDKLFLPQNYNHTFPDSINKWLELTIHITTLSIT